MICYFKMDILTNYKSSQANFDDEFLTWSGILLILLSNLVYWLCGRGIAFDDGNSFLGLNWWKDTNASRAVHANFFYDWAISALPVTILSGTLCNRISLFAFLINSVLITGVLQPMTIHWIWTPEGWLQQLGCTDPAGSSVTFVFAGASSFAASLIISLRNVEKFFIRSFQIYGIGSIITLIGFLILNHGTLYRMSKNQGTDRVLCESIENTIIGAAGGCLISMLISKLVNNNKHNQRSRMFSVTVNGSIAGIVAVYGSTKDYNSLESFIIGIVGALIFLQFHYLFVWLKVDDPSDAFPIYFGSGLWGVMAANIFTKNGILFNANTYDCLHKLFINFVGTLLISIWAAACTWLMFVILKILKILQKEDICQLKEVEPNNNAIRNEECYIEVLPYTEGTDQSQYLQVESSNPHINLYENLHSRRELRL